MNEIVVQCNVQNVNPAGNPRIHFKAVGVDGFLPFTTPFTEGDQTQYDFLSSLEGVECTIRTTATEVYPYWMTVINGVEFSPAGYEISNSPNSPWDASQLSSASSTINWT